MERADLTAPLTPEQEALKQEYVAARGYWRDWTEGLLRINPEFLSCYARYGGYPAAHGPLSPAMCELIYVALDASATHLFAQGLELHMGLALQRGATPRQVMDVLQLCTAQGLAGVNVGVQILAEELGDTAFPAVAALSPEQTAAKARYAARFDDWPAHCDLLLRLDPGYFAVMCDLLIRGETGDGLDERSDALIRLALDACFTGMNPDGIRLHIRRALRLGASPEEILQVLQMTAHLGVHACSLGVPLLMKLAA